MQVHIERFIRFLAAEKGLSVAYQISVRQTLEEFSRFLGEGDADPSRVDTGSLAEFLRHLQSRGMARSSMRVEMVHLRIFSAGWPERAFWRRIPPHSWKCRGRV